MEALLLPECTFDHSPMILQPTQDGGGRKPFRFFNYWVVNPQFQDEVREAQCQDTGGKGVQMFKVTQKLKFVKHKMKALNKIGGDHLQNEDSKLYTKLMEVQKQLCSDPKNSDLVSLEQEIRLQYEENHMKYLSKLS